MRNEWYNRQDATSDKFICYINSYILYTPFNIFLNPEEAPQFSPRCHRIFCLLCDLQPNHLITFHIEPTLTLSYLGSRFSRVSVLHVEVKQATVLKYKTIYLVCGANAGTRGIPRNKLSRTIQKCTNMIDALLFLNEILGNVSTNQRSLSTTWEVGTFLVSHFENQSEYYCFKGKLISK